MMSQVKGKREIRRSHARQQQQGQQQGESGLLGLQQTEPQEERLYHVEAQA